MDGLTCDHISPVNKKICACRAGTEEEIGEDGQRYTRLVCVAGHSRYPPPAVDTIKTKLLEKGEMEKDREKIEQLKRDARSRGITPDDVLWRAYVTGKRRKVTPKKPIINQLDLFGG